jgi:hypothetical protein|tara:strand:- start:91 stop:255 length:165 start_codon:yes stop_codon:yes gene_type:complete
MLIGGAPAERWAITHYYLKEMLKHQQKAGLVDFELKRAVKWIDKDVLAKQGEGV